MLWPLKRYTTFPYFKMEKLTVLILTAGYGRRMGIFSRMINKSLLPYGNKPLISHIINKFPPDTHFVVACGHLGQQVKDYLASSHPEKDIVYVDVPDYGELNTGPATSVVHCKKYLPGAFMLITCDTLFEFDYSDKLDHSWMAVYPVDSNISQDYCWVKRNGNTITHIYNKMGSPRAVDAFIGLLYVTDTSYINRLEQVGAREVYQGFDLKTNVHAYTVEDWKDFGTYEKWKSLDDALSEPRFPKTDEIFYNDNNRIIKFSTNPQITEFKYQRSILNSKCMPPNIRNFGNFLSYEFVPGESLYSCISPEIFLKFLNWTRDVVWDLNSPPLSNPSFNADAFYRLKTLERISKFRTKYAGWAEFNVVNESSVDTIENYISRFPFDILNTIVNERFTHGDMQFDNIIYDKKLDRFTIIDWRSDFSGNLYGDVYYDIAKLVGGLYLNLKDVKDNKFSYTEHNNAVILKIPQIDDLELYITILKEWMAKEGLIWRKVELLVPIIYLNMAPLHDYPFDKFMIAMSQLFFSKLQ